jgi:hypothetical protein
VLMALTTVRVHSTADKPACVTPCHVLLANIGCAICDGNAPDMVATGRCMEPIMDLVSTCSDGTSNACRWFTPEYVCAAKPDGSLYTYLNPSW